MNNYEDIEFVERGRFASVFKARDVTTNQAVALKKMWVKSSLHQNTNSPKSYPSRCISREIKILRILQHDAHIIGLLDTFAQDEYVFIVLEYMNIDLHQLLTNMPPKRTFTEQECQHIAIQLFRGLDALHTNNIVHRDLKPANILFDETGVLKIADLGQARIIHSSSTDTSTEDSDEHNENEKKCKAEGDRTDNDDGGHSAFSAVIRGSSITLSKKDFSPSPHIEDGQMLTNEVGTRWYKSPELLYGTRKYDFSVDIWSAGCIIAEMLQSEPLFCGETDIDQLCKIFHILGTINLRDYADAINLPDFNKIVFNEIVPKQLHELWPTLSEEVIHLIGSCLKFNPDSRITSIAAIQHLWFGHNGKETTVSGKRNDEFCKLIVTATGKLVQARKRKMEHFHDNDAKEDGDDTDDDEVISITSDILNECDLLDMDSNPI